MSRGFDSLTRKLKIRLQNAFKPILTLSIWPNLGLILGLELEMPFRPIRRMPRVPCCEIDQVLEPFYYWNSDFSERIKFKPIKIGKKSRRRNPNHAIRVWDWNWVEAKGLLKFRYSEIGESKEMGGEDADGNKSKQWSSPNRTYKEKHEDPKLWGIFLFGLIGATATTFAVSSSITSFKVEFVFHILIDPFQIFSVITICTFGFSFYSFKFNCHWTKFWEKKKFFFFFGGGMEIIKLVLVGAAIVRFPNLIVVAIWQVSQLRRSVDWIYTQVHQKKMIFHG